MHGEEIEIIGRAFFVILVLAVIGVVLGIWKLIEVGIWLWSC